MTRHFRQFNASTFFHFVVACGIVWSISYRASAQVGGGFDLTWSTIDAGGGYSAGGNFELEGAIGQPDAGIMFGGDFQLTGGFWYEQPNGDCNATGTVDLLDYRDLESCLLGPSGEFDVGCDCFDFDHDGDIDLLDFSEFQALYASP